MSSFDYPIGGYFEVVTAKRQPRQQALAYWGLDRPETLAFRNARSALAHLLRALRPPRVWLPAYICDPVVHAVSAARRPWSFFPVDSRLEPDTGFLDTHLGAGDFVLAVDYWGRLPGAAFQSLVERREDVAWLEDRGQALLPVDSGWGDYLLYSPRKLLGVPDGGVLVPLRKPAPPPDWETARRYDFLLPGLVRAEERREPERADRLFQKAERAMRVGREPMSRFTMRLLAALDAPAYAEARRRNYEILASALGGRALWRDGNWPEVPLGYPLLVNNPVRLQAELAQRRIFASRHWGQLPSPAETFPDAHEVASQSLTLPCDHRYNVRDMEYLARSVLELLSRRSRAA